MNYYFDAIKKYTVFSGRATRTQYWMFLLINVLISIVLSLLSGVHIPPFVSSMANIFDMVYQLFIVIPTIAITARRLHDINKTGWWQLLYLIPFIGALIVFIFLVLPTKLGINKYDPQPVKM